MLLDDFREYLDSIAYKNDGYIDEEGDYGQTSREDLCNLLPHANRSDQLQIISSNQNIVQWNRSS